LAKAPSQQLDPFTVQRACPDLAFTVDPFRDSQAGSGDRETFPAILQMYVQETGGSLIAEEPSGMQRLHKVSIIDTMDSVGTPVIAIFSSIPGDMSIILRNQRYQ
jgi:hypothetical protein